MLDPEMVDKKGIWPAVTVVMRYLSLSHDWL